MINVDNWNYYYNFEKGQNIRANLVYTPLVSPDKKNFCLWFARDPKYHFDEKINQLWTNDLLEDRFRKELKYHKIASKYVPTLKIIDVDEKSKKIIIEWPGDDFYSQSLNLSPSDVLPDWKYQMKNILGKLWKNNIVKLSLHPNSWTIYKEELVPFNWFFCYDIDTGKDRLDNLLIQISETRLEKIYSIFKHLGYDLSNEYCAIDLQKISLHSFKSNYDTDLIDDLIKKLDETNNRN
jgi:hypothetical protein